MFGHALEGNLHFVITHDLGRAGRGRPLPPVHGRGRATWWWTSYDGSLKAEHGTGRNMAPFVELEWGAQAYALMREIKDIFDPTELLNPGVILNDDPEVHLKNLKPLPAGRRHRRHLHGVRLLRADVPVAGDDPDAAPAHRRHAARSAGLRAAGREAEQVSLAALYDYQGIDTCAACGLCATACPVGIETGILTKKLREARAERYRPASRRYRRRSLRHGDVGDPSGPAAGRSGQRALGPGTLEAITGTVRRLSRDRIPAWSRTMPGGASFTSGRQPRELASTGRRSSICRAASRGPWGRRATIAIATRRCRARRRRCWRRPATTCSIRGASPACAAASRSRAKGCQRWPTASRRNWESACAKSAATATCRSSPIPRRAPTGCAGSCPKSCGLSISRSSSMTTCWHDCAFASGRVSSPCTCRARRRRWGWAEARGSRQRLRRTGDRSREHRVLRLGRRQGLHHAGAERARPAQSEDASCRRPVPTVTQQPDLRDRACDAFRSAVSLDRLSGRCLHDASRPRRVKSPVRN